MQQPDHGAPFPHATTPEEFAANLDAVRARIAAAAHRAGREASEVELLPVSKTVPQERLRAAIAAGCTTLGRTRCRRPSASTASSPTWTSAGR
nr:hypothetical protein [Propioniciclava coleopterorum]